MVRKSPFIFEEAVPKEKFFDRREEIEFFIRNINVKRKILLCIVAPLKYGKSSLMYRYYDILREFSDIVPIYVNLKVEDAPVGFIVEELKKYDIDLTETYRECLDKGSLKKFFSILGDLLEGMKKWLFVLFDEFHLLPERVRNEGFYSKFGDSDIFGFFRGFAEGARISYVVCGSVIEPLMNALDVWGGRFQLIYLGPFNERDALYMIKKLFAEGGMEISEEHARIIVEAAGHHPFYMQYMGHQIYVEGAINRRTIRIAKQKLFEFLSPLFFEYLERIRGMGRGYIEAIAKLIHDKPLAIDDRVALGRLMRIGILKPKNARFQFVDPLFERYIRQIIEGLEPTEVTVVGHWAERIVGNYLLRKGHIPYYSHDSRGAFDIYVKIGEKDIGIQVKYSTQGYTYLSREDTEAMISEAKKLGWIPILALISKQLRFFPNIRPGKYSIEQGYAEIEDAINKLSNTQ